jgi:hypothetical protein
VHLTPPGGIVSETKNTGGVLNDGLHTAVVTLGEIVRAGEQSGGLAALDQLDESRRRQRRRRGIVEERRERIDYESSWSIFGQECAHIIENTLGGTGLRNAAHEIGPIPERDDALGSQSLEEADIERGRAREELGPGGVREHDGNFAPVERLTHELKRARCLSCAGASCEQIARSWTEAAAQLVYENDPASNHSRVSVIAAGSSHDKSIPGNSQGDNGLARGSSKSTLRADCDSRR